MNVDKNYLTQKQRLIWVFIYALLFIGLNRVLFGFWAPSFSETGFWFYAGIASLVLGHLISTPFFTPPSDVTAYSVTALFGMFAVNKWDQWVSWEHAIFSLCALYFGLVCLSAIIAILLKDSKNEKTSQLSESAKLIAMRCGDCSAVFGVLIFFSLVTFHRNSAVQILSIGSLWVVVGILKPEQLLHGISRGLRGVWRKRNVGAAIGTIHAYQTPNIVLVAQDERQPLLKPGVAVGIGGLNSLGVCLDYVGRDDSRYLRVLDLNEPVQDDCRISEKTVVRLNHSHGDVEDLIGIVTEETDVGILYFEVTRECDIEEGSLVEVTISEKPVMYQVVNGVAKEEIVSQKNTFGFVRAKAKKIGQWDARNQKFLRVSWVPNINTPVYLKKPGNSSDLPVTAVGRFPKTSLPVNIKSIHELVTHNTAILGILGVGKTKLSVELIERMLAEKIHVISIDLTDEHKKEFPEYFACGAAVDDEVKVLMAVGQSGRTASKQNKEEGGSIYQFKEKFKEQLSAFIDSDEQLLRIYNPAQFVVWRQTGGQYQGSAAMESLTPTGVTQIISECVLEILQSKGLSNGNARVCLIYEEAHSLVPEWNSAVMEGDKAATNGTARAVLQGRKYGMGCLLITQRTANVTKTILNQCNTIFAMRTFDDTGKDFLANYLGREYAATLPELQERHAVFFGKASSCENPILIRLNDQDNFRKFFRAEHPVPVHEVEVIEDPSTTRDEDPF